MSHEPWVTRAGIHRRSGVKPLAKTREVNQRGATSEPDEAFSNCAIYLARLLGALERPCTETAIDNWHRAMFDECNVVFHRADKALKSLPFYNTVTTPELAEIFFSAKQLVDFVRARPSLELGKWGLDCPHALIEKLDNARAWFDRMSRRTPARALANLANNCAPFSAPHFRMVFVRCLRHPDPLIRRIAQRCNEEDKTRKHSDIAREEIHKSNRSINQASLLQKMRKYEKRVVKSRPK